MVITSHAAFSDRELTAAEQANADMFVIEQCISDARAYLAAWPNLPGCANIANVFPFQVSLMPHCSADYQTIAARMNREGWRFTGRDFRCQFSNTAIHTFYHAGHCFQIQLYLDPNMIGEIHTDY